MKIVSASLMNAFFSGPSPTKKDEFAASKVGKGQTKELLQIFDIRGTSVSRIYASKNFRKFVTIDDAGLVYVLQEVQK